MSLEEFEEKTDQRTSRYKGMKSVMDIGMGLIYIAIAVFILFGRKFNFRNEFMESLPGKIFAGVIIIYGSWRVYRGFKKDYFVER